MNRTGGNKNRKRTTVVLCVVAVLAACAWTGIEYAIRKAVLHEVRHIAGESATVQAGRIGFNPLRRSVRIRNLHIATDSSRTKESRADIKHMAVHIRRIDLDGLRRTKKEGGQSVSVGSITLKRPDVSIVLADRRATSARPAKRENTAGTIDIGRFVLQDGTFEICRTTDGRTSCRRAEGIAFETGGFRLDKSAPDPEALSRTALALSVRRMEYTFGRGSMKWQVDTIALDTRQGSFSVEALRLLPQYPKDEFASLAPGHADWTQVKTGRIAGHGIDFAALVHEKTLRADSLSIENAEVSSFKNRQIEAPKRRKTLFFQTLQRMPLRTDIRVTSFGNVKARYEELPLRGTVAGVVAFDSLRGSMTRDPDDASRLRHEAQGLLMGTAPLQAVFRFPAATSGDRFDVEGRLGRFDLQAMNKTTEPLGGIRIDAGQVENMRFRIEGDTVRSSVTMLLLYEGLDVSLMRENERGQFRERRILSALADDWLVRKSNPERENLRDGTGSCTRDPYRSQFNYLWKSLLPGIESTVLAGRKSHDLLRRSGAEK